MGEVSSVTYGQWDRDGQNPLFDKYRAAKEGGRFRAMLLDQLLRANTPLIKRLVAQVRGKKIPGQPLRKAFRLVGAEKLEWDDAMNRGRFAFMKAMPSFDPTKGRISGYLVKKIFYELQCELGDASMVRVARGEDHPKLAYIDDKEGHLERLLEDDDEDGEPEQLEHLEQLEELAGEQLVAPVSAGTAIAAAAVLVTPALDERSALEVFLEDVCRFVRSGRTATSILAGGWRELASARGEVQPRGALAIALRERGARRTTVRVPWAPTPVEGFAGVSLQSESR